MVRITPDDDAFWYAEEEDDERRYWTHSQWDVFNKKRAEDTEKQLRKLLGKNYIEVSTNG